MPIGEIAGELLGGIFRILGNFLAEVVFEILVKGLGYLVCRLFSKSVDPDGISVVLAGFAAWGVIFVALYFGYDYLSSQLEIDRCLDAGGSYRYATNECLK